MLDSGTQISIPYNRKRLMRILLGSIGFMIVGLLYIFIPFINTNSLNSNPFKFGGYVFIVTSLITGIPTLKRLINHKPGFLIDSRAIHDYSGAFYAGPILWADITQTRISKIFGQKLIVVIVNNPQTYINNQKNWFTKITMSLNHIFYNSPFCINAAELNISITELFERIEGYPKTIKGL